MRIRGEREGRAAWNYAAGRATGALVAVALATLALAVSPAAAVTPLPTVTSPGAYTNDPTPEIRGKAAPGGPGQPGPMPSAPPVPSTDHTAYIAWSSQLVFFARPILDDRSTPAVAVFVSDPDKPPPSGDNDRVGYSAIDEDGDWKVDFGELHQQLGPADRTFDEQEPAVASALCPLSTAAAWQTLCKRGAPNVASPLKPDGRYRVQVRHASGHASGETTHHFILDTTAPIVTLVLDQAQPVGGYTGPVTGRVSVVDANFGDPAADPDGTLECSFGQASVAVSPDPSDPQNPKKGVFTLNGSPGADEELKCTATDLAQNPGDAEQQVRFAAGDTDPIVEVTADPAAAKGANDWFVGSSTRFNVSVQDGNIDPSGVVCTLTPGGLPLMLKNVQTTAGGVEAAVDVEQDDANLGVTCDATDSGNNQDSDSFAFKRDGAAPVTHDDVAQRTPGQEITLSTDPDTSGVQATHYEKGSNPPEPTTSSPTYDPANKPTLADGERITYFSVDNAGNVEEEVRTSVPIGDVDTTKPLVQLSVTPAPDGSNDYYRAAVPTVDVTVTEANAVAELSCTPALTHIASDQKSGNVAITAEGNHTVTCSATDVSGNVSGPASRSVNVDKTAPTTTDNVPVSATGDSYTVRLSASDPVSGADKTYYTTGTGDPVTSGSVYDDANPPTLTHGQTITYASVDRAGNQETPKSKTVNLTASSNTGGGSGNGDGGSGSGGGGGGGSGGGGSGGSSASGGGGVPAGGSGPTATPPVQATASVRTQKLSAVLKKGLAAVVDVGQASKVTAKLLVDKRTAKRLRLKSIVLGSRSTSLPAGKRTLTIPLSAKAKRALRRVRSLRAKVELTVANAQGATTKLVKPVTLRR